MRDAINEEEKGEEWKFFLWKLTFRPTYILRRVVVTWIPSEEDRINQKKKAGLVEAMVEEEDKRSGASRAGEKIRLK